MKKLKNILSIVGLILYISFSVGFYYKIDVKLACFIVFIEVVSVFICDLLDNQSKQKYLIYIIQICVCIMSLFGFVANGLNTTIDVQNADYKDVINVEYTNVNNKKTILETQLRNSQDELNKYPNFDNYVKNLNMSDWEDKTQVAIDYNKSKNELIKNIKDINQNLLNLKIPEEKLKVKKSDSKGFNEMLYFVHNVTSISIVNITILIYLIIGIISLSIIYTLKYLKVKDNLNFDILKSEPVKDTLEVKDIVETVGITESEPVKDTLEFDILNVKDTLEFDILNVKDTLNFDILKYLKENYKKDDCINIAEIKTKFLLNDYDLKKLRNYLKEECVIYTQNKKSYLT